MTENDGFADTPGRAATPEEEARVTALLGSLRDDDLPMPDHVWSRLSAVIAEEHVAATARRISGEPGALSDAAEARTTPAPLATVSVLPGPEDRRRRGAPRWLLGAAAAAVVVLLAGGLVKGLGTGASSSSGGSVADAAAAPSVVAGSASAESHSNTAYTKTQLPAQASSLVARPRTGAVVPGANNTFAAQGSTGGGTASGASSALAATADTAAVPPSTDGTPAPSPSGSVRAPAAPPLLSGAALTACLAQITGNSTTSAIAVDRGTFDGKPADIVVVPTENDSKHLDVWVLAPGCTGSNADVLSFARIARP